jgi:glycosyltransferase involved in cell wall biosynthesis
MTGRRPLVSIIINNFNYGRFLAEAIESALGQDYPAVEVIVVDDGSTDDSAQVIAGYDQRIRALFQANGGQAAALNSGFAASQGEIIFFLDADDRLRPTIARQAVERFAACPAAGRVHFRLAQINGTGQPTGRLMPPPGRPLPSGDLRQQVLLFGDDLGWLPTSGNAFRRETLRQIMPVPAESYRSCADYYLLNLSALVGEVASLDETGGDYRVHGANADYRAGLDLERSRRTVHLTQKTHEALRARAATLEPAPARIAPGGVSYVAHRLLSLRLEPGRHPVAGERLWPLVGEGVRVAFRRFDRPWPVRTLYAAWFLAAAVAPRRTTAWLGRRLFGLNGG